MSEYRLLLGVITFVGIFALLIGSAPLGYLVETEGTGSLSQPSAFATLNTYNYTGYHYFTINETTFETLSAPGFMRYFYPINGTLYLMSVIRNETGSYLGVQLNVVLFYAFGFAVGDPLSFYGPEGAALGTYLTRDQMNYDFNTFTSPYAIPYNVSTDIALFNQTLILAWDNSTYSDPWDAFDSQALKVLHGLRWVNPASAVIPVLTPLEQYAANIGAVLAFALDPRIPFLIRSIIFTPIGAAIGYLMFWIGKTILHG
jgi:hypothetical protein